VWPSAEPGAVPNFLEVGTKKKRDSAGLVPGFTMHGGPEIFGTSIPEMVEKKQNMFCQIL